MNNFQWIWNYAKVYKVRLLIALIFVVANSILIIVNPVVSGMLVDQVIEQGKGQLLLPLLGVMIGITLF